jgi:hypothetical protein
MHRISDTPATAPANKEYWNGSGFSHKIGLPWLIKKFSSLE